MSYQKITTTTLQQLKNIVGTTKLHNTHPQRTIYGKDKTKDLIFLPEVVVLPQSTADISQIMQLCYQENIPLTPRGAGTRLAESALLLCGGLILSLERLNQFLNSWHTLIARSQESMALAGFKRKT